jgi:hypothetical protein
MGKMKEQIVLFHSADVGGREAETVAEVVRSGWFTN